MSCGRFEKVAAYKARVHREEVARLQAGAGSKEKIKREVSRSKEDPLLLKVIVGSC